MLKPLVGNDSLQVFVSGMVVIRAGVSGAGSTPTLISGVAMKSFSLLHDGLALTITSCSEPAIQRQSQDGSGLS